MTAKTPKPSRDPQAWQVRIGDDVRGPDQKVMLAEVFGLKTKATLDKDKASGENGATVKFKGDELATFSIRLTCWTEEGLNMVLDLCVLARKATRAGKGVRVAHPLLDRAEVSAMIVEDIDWPDPGQKMVATLSCVQFRAQTDTGKSVAKAITSADAPAAIGDGKLITTPKKPPKPKMPWEQKVPT